MSGLAILEVRISKKIFSEKETQIVILSSF